MMKKKYTTNDILNEVGFNDEEKEMFLACLNKAKEEQKNDTINAQKYFEDIIKEAYNDVI